MSIGQKLTQIAKNIPNVYGKGYVMGQTEGYQRGYSDGSHHGGISAREQCLMQHYTASFFGSGTGELRHNIPFKPDIISVYTTHSGAGYLRNCYRGFVADLRGCGSHMGNFFFVTENGVPQSGWTRSDASGNGHIWNNGVFTYSNTMSAVKNAIWMPFIRYHIVAVRFPEESAKALLQEQIQMLPDQVPQGNDGKLVYAKSMINQYFSAEEWEALIAQKPNWTITLE